VFENLGFDWRAASSVRDRPFRRGKTTVLEYSRPASTSREKARADRRWQAIEGHPASISAVICQSHALLRGAPLFGPNVACVTSKWRKWERRQGEAHAHGFLDLGELSGALAQAASETVTAGEAGAVELRARSRITPKIIADGTSRFRRGCVTRGTMPDRRCALRRRICLGRTGQTAVMIHPRLVDEAELSRPTGFSVMTKRSGAVWAEIVEKIPAKGTRRIV